jgi:hypothetical protein
MPCPASIVLHNVTDVLVHAGSTLGIEAHLCNIPAFSFHGLINQVPGHNYPHVSPDFEDAGELIGAIKGVELDKSNANLESVKLLEKEFYGTIDGKACERAVEKISSFEIKPTCTPDVWPPDGEKEFYTPGVFKVIEQWTCECCHKVSITKPGKDMIKCPWCGIALAKAAPQDQIIDKKNWQPVKPSA